MITIRKMAQFWWIWAAVYAATGIFGMGKHSTGIFAHPVDHFDSVSFKIAFLNFPLQMALALLATALNDQRFPGAKAHAWILGVTATIMIVVNFAIGIWLNFV